MKPIYLGVVGQIASGKGVFVDYLKKTYGFRSISLSSILHEELEKRSIKEFTRETLQDLGDELRKQFGNDVLAKQSLIKIKNYKLNKNLKLKIKNFLIEGIRNPAEIEFFKKNLKNFILIGIKAKRELRYQRLLSRAKSWDPMIYKEFLKIDRRDLGLGQNKSGQQVGRCLAYCDYILTNNGDREAFERKISNHLVGAGLETAGVA